MDYGKYLASKPALAVVTLIALQTTFFLVPLYTLTVDGTAESLTVLDDWVLDVGHVTAPPYAPRYTAFALATTDPLPPHRPVKPFLWAYFAAATASLVLWALGGWKRTRDPSLYSALIAAVLGAYVVDAVALYVAQLDSSRGQSAALGVQNVLLLAWPIVPLAVEAGGSLAEFVT